MNVSCKKPGHNSESEWSKGKGPYSHSCKCTRWSAKGNGRRGRMSSSHSFTRPCTLCHNQTLTTLSSTDRTMLDSYFGFRQQQLKSESSSQSQHTVLSVAIESYNLPLQEWERSFISFSLVVQQILEGVIGTYRNVSWGSILRNFQKNRIYGQFVFSALFLQFFLLPQWLTLFTCTLLRTYTPRTLTPPLYAHSM